MRCPRILGVVARLAAAAVAVVSCQIASYHTADDCRVEDCWYATFYSVDIRMGSVHVALLTAAIGLRLRRRTKGQDSMGRAMSVRYARESGFGRCSKSLIEVFLLGSG
jgi:hypothetical protein